MIDGAANDKALGDTDGAALGASEGEADGAAFRDVSLRSETTEATLASVTASRNPFTTSASNARMEALSGVPSCPSSSFHLRLSNATGSIGMT